ncbi:1486_t:CDS:2 [Funneliformis geosporum]|uniref:1486_t:CDS:1 n=1 Tax=Funneliformis geosporum TaxID=1117311 RepID=A0A9W4WS21_9GLOM|nr:1486_t:CDS:2 [Funneliformis geosporum]
MGFDIFSSLFCIYGGTIVGVIGGMGNEGRQGFFNSHVNPNANTNFNGSEGFLFSAMVWIPERICNTEEETEYIDLGEVNVSPDAPLPEKNQENKNVIKIAQKKETKTSA